FPPPFPQWTSYLSSSTPPAGCVPYRRQRDAVFALTRSARMRRRSLTVQLLSFVLSFLLGNPNADLKRSGKSAFEIERIMSEGNFRVKFFLRSSHKKIRSRKTKKVLGTRFLCVSDAISCYSK